jgi:hypothetical protein
MDTGLRRYDVGLRRYDEGLRWYDGVSGAGLMQYRESGALADPISIVGLEI